MPARPVSSARSPTAVALPALLVALGALIAGPLVPDCGGWLRAQEPAAREAAARDTTPTDSARGARFREARGPDLMRQGDVLYVTGGIGLTEREALEAMARREGFNLKVVVADREGTFLADVPVRIARPDGAPSLEAVLEGPWLYARLPAGEYRIQGRFASGRQEATVTVPAEGRRELVLTAP